MLWIEKNAPKPPQLEAKTIKCTVCNEYLDFKSQSQCQRHPDLGLIFNFELVVIDDIMLVQVS